MGKIKIILGAIVVGVIGCVVAGVAILQSMDFNQYKGDIEKLVEESTGRKLTIAGDLNLEISLSPRVSVDGVTFANSSWGSRPEMVKVKSFAAQMELVPLVFGNINITEVILIEPDILIETDKKGNGNWVMSATKSEDEEKEEASSSSDSDFNLPAINALRIEKARFTYKDGANAKTDAVVIDLMEATAASISSPLEILFKGSLNDHVITLSGNVKTPEKLMKGDSIDLDLALEAVGAAFNINGSIAKPMEGKGLNLAISAKSENIARLAELAGTSVGKVGPFEMAATVSDDDKTYKIGGLNLKIADSDFAGNVAINLANKTPLITANLSSKYLNVASVTPQSVDTNAAAPAATPAPVEKSTDKKKAAKIFPSDPLPLDGLKAVNADITYKAATLVVSDFTLTEFSKNVSLKNGNLITKPAFKMGGGALTGQVQLNAQKVPATLNIKLDGNDLGLGDSLKTTGVTDLIHDGKTQLDINLAARGKSVSELMATLDGKTLINVGEGKIKSNKVNFLGGDLVTGVFEKILPSANSGEFTPFSCAVVNLDFQNGVTSYKKKIAMQTNVMNVVSSGKIDLVTETLDIGVNPEPRGDTADLGISASGLASMVRLTGPLSSPGIGLDAMGTAKAAVGLGAAIATGGVSLLVSGLADKALSDSDPCATALGTKSSSAKPAEKSSSGSSSTETKSSNPVGGLLKMFGGSK